MVKLRLKRGGRKKHATYQIVAIDVRSRREGRYLGKVGIYDAINNQMYVNAPAIIYFLERGAQPTDTVWAILKNSEPVQKHLEALKVLRRICIPFENETMNLIQNNEVNFWYPTVVRIIYLSFILIKLKIYFDTCKLKIYQNKNNNQNKRFKRTLYDV